MGNSEIEQLRVRIDLAEAKARLADLTRTAGKVVVMFEQATARVQPGRELGQWVAMMPAHTEAQPAGNRKDRRTAKAIARRARK